MKHFFLDLLACPFCHAFPFRLFIFKKTAERPNEDAVSHGSDPYADYCSDIGNETQRDRSLVGRGCRPCRETEITTGILFCEACRRWFPIHEGIPSIMPDNLRNRNDLNWLKSFENRLPVKIYQLARVFSSGYSNTQTRTEENDTDKKKEMKVRNHESGTYDSLFPDDKFRAELEVYDRLLEPSPGSWVLDLGCGTGRITKQILRKRACVVGLDFSFESLLYCRNHMPPGRSHGLHLVHGDVCFLPFRKEIFHDVLSAGLFCNLPGAKMRNMGLEQAARVLKREGSIVISVYNFSLLKKLRGLAGLAQTGCREGHKKNGLYYYNHTPQEFLKWLGRYFHVTDLVGTDNRVPLFQQLSPNFNAWMDRALSSTALSLPLFSREMTARGVKNKSPEET
jgi:uncharacterized protein YbaR (Trm112 family)/ubiquinone/menaquinone biosynthesis C-methylase UbiE